MDPAELARALAESLGPYLPYLASAGQKVGEKALEEIGKKAGGEGFEKAKGLWGKLEPKVEAKPEAAEAVRDAAASPDDPDVQAALRVQLRKILGAEPGFAAELAQLLEAARPNVTQKAKVRGSGAAAQGKGAVAAGKKGKAAGRDLFDHSTTIHHQTVQQIAPSSGADESTLRKAYLRCVAEQAGYVSLAGVDPTSASDREAKLKLEAVYTALLTLSTVVNLKKSPKGQPGSRRRSAVEELDRHPRLVLLGDPGSGKSTFANFVALCHAGQALGLPGVGLKLLTSPLPDDDGNDQGERQPWKHGPLLPVRVVLRDFAARGLPKPGARATANHLWRFLEEELRRLGLPEFFPFFKKTLLTEGGLLLLDGLDEVPEAEERRGQIQQALESFVQVLGDCRILLTSRTYAYRNQGWSMPSFAEAVLAPFSAGQIRRFVRRWYEHLSALGRLQPGDATGRAALLERAIFGSDRLRGLAERPLLLTLMASLHAWRGGNLPERREQLYAEAVDLLLHRWESQRVVFDEQGKPAVQQPSLAEFLEAGKDNIRKVLEELAYEAHALQPDAAGTADVAEERLVSRLMRLSRVPRNPALLVAYLRDRAGLLEPRGVGVYTFPHRTFQEYLAACHLMGADTFPDRVAELGRKDPARWREVVLLAGAKASGGGVWQLAETLCDLVKEDPPADLEDAWGAQLAGQVAAESADLSRVGRANQPKLERLRQRLVGVMRDERFPATERALAGRSLARLGDPRFDPDAWYLPKEPLLGFVEIPAGRSWMGSDPTRDQYADEDEEPYHELELPTFYIGRYPVTVQQFSAFVAASGYEPEDRRSLEGPSNHPVGNVTWYGALAYCEWLGERLRELAKTPPLWEGLSAGRLQVTLPSEAEWEKAARGRDGRIYPWGDEPDPQRANYEETGIGSPNAVGCFPDGASLGGCEEMSGNVWEWTRSAYKDYPYKAGDGREDLSKVAKERPRVLRGGSYILNSRLARCAFRNRNLPTNRNRNVGFRVAVSPFSSGL